MCFHLTYQFIASWRCWRYCWVTPPSAKFSIRKTGSSDLFLQAWLPDTRPPSDKQFTASTAANKLYLSANRGSHSQMFFKIGILRTFAIFTEKRLRWSLFLIKLQTWRPKTLLKRDSNTGVFCEYCEIFKSSFVYGTPLVVVSKCTKYEIFIILWK